MRYLSFVLFAVLALPAHAQISSGMSERLCLAASQESAFGALVDDLIESDELALTSGEQAAVSGGEPGERFRRLGR